MYIQGFPADLEHITRIAPLRSPRQELPELIPVIRRFPLAVRPLCDSRDDPCGADLRILRPTVAIHIRRVVARIDGEDARSGLLLLKHIRVVYSQGVECTLGRVVGLTYEIRIGLEFLELKVGMLTTNLMS
jgi:hypothetical protein